MYKSGHVYAAMIGHITANAFAVIRTETGILKWTVDGSVMAWCILSHVPWCWHCDILLLCKTLRVSCLAWSETERRQSTSIVQLYEYGRCNLE